MSQGKSGKFELPRAFTLISAQTGKDHDEGRHQSLQRDLTDNGFALHEVRGHYGHPEKSFLVPHNGSLEAKLPLNDLARKYNQESILHSVAGRHELHFTSGQQSYTGEGHDEGEHLSDYFTELPDGRRIQLNVAPPKEEHAHISKAVAVPVRRRHHGEAEAAEWESLTLAKAEPKTPTVSMPGRDRIRAVADGYAKERGLTLNHDVPRAKVNPERAGKIAQAFHEMKHAPHAPDVKEAYDALVNETHAQFQHIKASGLKMSPIQHGQENPYKNGSKDMLRDVHENNHLWFYPTTSGFGSGPDRGDHPLMRETGETVGGHKLLANDMFRIVHDYFGHAKEGHTFGPHGEENAWIHHKQMYSPAAVKALTAETRGQNSWVNFGPHAEHNRANPDKTVYADQKAGLLPEWAHEHDELKKSDPEQAVRELLAGAHPDEYQRGACAGFAHALQQKLGTGTLHTVDDHGHAVLQVGDRFYDSRGGHSKEDLTQYRQSLHGKEQPPIDFVAHPNIQSVEAALENTPGTAEKVADKLLRRTPLTKGPVRLVHFSPRDGLADIDPSKMGTSGVRSEEYRRGLPEVARSYFYREGSKYEPMVEGNARSKYTVELPADHKLYDLSNDHEGHIKAALEENGGAWNSDRVLTRIKSAGYHGFMNSSSQLPNVVALFHAVKPEKEEKIAALGKSEGLAAFELSILGAPQRELLKAKLAELRSRARSLKKSEKPKKVTLKAADLSKNDDDACADCSSRRLPCLCFGKLPMPDISVKNGKVSVLFKSEWSEEERETFLEQFKRRARRYITEKLEGRRG